MTSVPYRYTNKRENQVRAQTYLFRKDKQTCIVARSRAVSTPTRVIITITSADNGRNTMKLEHPILHTYAQLDIIVCVWCSRKIQN